MLDLVAATAAADGDRNTIIAVADHFLVVQFFLIGCQLFFGFHETPINLVERSPKRGLPVGVIPVRRAIAARGRADGGRASPQTFERGLDMPLQFGEIAKFAPRPVQFEPTRIHLTVTEYHFSTAFNAIGRNREFDSSTRPQKGPAAYTNTGPLESSLSLHIATSCPHLKISVSIIHSSAGARLRQISLIAPCHGLSGGKALTAGLKYQSILARIL